MYSAIEEADFLAIDGEFSGSRGGVIIEIDTDVPNVGYVNSVCVFRDKRWSQCQCTDQRAGHTGGALH